MISNNDDELVDVLQTASRRRHPGGGIAAPEQPATEPVPTESIAFSAPTPPTEESSPMELPDAALAELPAQLSIDPKPAQVTDKPMARVANDYARHLLKSARGKKGKSIQLDEENHSALTHIAATMGGVTIADLLHNIVRLHFQQYGPAIQQMLKEKEALNKKKKLPFQRP
ncbi:DUF3408 domain-containing protein [Hymenobacter volaticus]|uniref:DUF3408 domain-containing protein n=1 Tax=Hymenobacter volaticus TaxID=2932254 RepID=A0ABY4GF61_9BACT|nr:DUF3408 domain-containing protein [Hymenobacter volaticus]UOQ69580.1 DUF3408 domain-containing protein [Hymenobacter volaticus]